LEQNSIFSTKNQYSRTKFRKNYFW